MSASSQDLIEKQDETTEAIHEVIPPEKLERLLQSMISFITHGNYIKIIFAANELICESNKLKKFIGNGKKIATEKEIYDFNLEDASNFIKKHYLINISNDKIDMNFLKKGALFLEGLHTFLMSLNEDIEPKEVTRASMINMGFKLFAALANINFTHRAIKITNGEIDQHTLIIKKACLSIFHNLTVSELAELWKIWRETIDTPRPIGTSSHSDSYGEELSGSSQQSDTDELPFKKKMPISYQYFSWITWLEANWQRDSALKELEEEIQAYGQTRTQISLVHAPSSILASPTKNSTSHRPYRSASAPSIARPYPMSSHKVELASSQNYIQFWFADFFAGIPLSIADSSSTSTLVSSSTPVELVPEEPNLEKITILAQGLLLIAQEHRKYLSADAFPITYALLLLILLKHLNPNYKLSDDLVKNIGGIFNFQPLAQSRSIVSYSQTKLLFSIMYLDIAASNDETDHFNLSLHKRLLEHISLGASTIIESQSSSEDLFIQKLSQSERSIFQICFGHSSKNVDIYDEKLLYNKVIIISELIHRTNFLSKQQSVVEDSLYTHLREICIQQLFSLIDLSKLLMNVYQSIKHRNYGATLFHLDKLFASFMLIHRLTNTTKQTTSARKSLNFITNTEALVRRYATLMPSLETAMPGFTQHVQNIFIAFANHSGVLTDNDGEDEILAKRYLLALQLFIKLSNMFQQEHSAAQHNDDSIFTVIFEKSDQLLNAFTATERKIAILPETLVEDINTHARSVNEEITYISNYLIRNFPIDEAYRQITHYASVLPLTLKHQLWRDFQSEYYQSKTKTSGASSSNMLPMPESIPLTSGTSLVLNESDFSLPLSWCHFLIMRDLAEHSTADIDINAFREKLQQHRVSRHIDTSSTSAIDSINQSSYSSHPERPLASSSMRTESLQKQVNHLQIWFANWLEASVSNVAQEEKVNLLQQITNITIGLLLIVSEHKENLKPEDHALSYALLLLILAKHIESNYTLNQTICHGLNSIFTDESILAISNTNLFFTELKHLFAISYVSLNILSENKGSTQHNLNPILIRITKTFLPDPQELSAQTLIDIRQHATISIFASLTNRIPSIQEQQGSHSIEILFYPYLRSMCQACTFFEGKLKQILENIAEATLEKNYAASLFYLSKLREAYIPIIKCIIIDDDVDFDQIIANIVNFAYACYPSINLLFNNGDLLLTLALTMQKSLSLNDRIANINAEEPILLFKQLNTSLLIFIHMIKRDIKNSARAKHDKDELCRLNQHFDNPGKLIVAYERQRATQRSQLPSALRRILVSNMLSIQEEIDTIIQYLKTNELLEKSYIGLTNYSKYLSPKRAYQLWHAYYKEQNVSHPQLMPTSGTLSDEGRSISFEQFQFMQDWNEHWQNSKAISALITQIYKYQPWRSESSTDLHQIQRSHSLSTLPAPRSASLPSVSSLTSQRNIADITSASAVSFAGPQNTQVNHLRLWFVRLLEKIIPTLAMSTEQLAIQAFSPCHLHAITASSSEDASNIPEIINLKYIEALAMGLLHIAKAHANYLEADSHPLTFALILFILSHTYGYDIYHDEALCQLLLQCFEKNKSLSTPFFVEIKLLFAIVATKIDKANKGSQALALYKQMTDLINRQFDRRIKPESDARGHKHTHIIHIDNKEYKDITSYLRSAPSHMLSEKQELLAESIARVLGHFHRKAQDAQDPHAIEICVQPILLDSCDRLTARKTQRLKAGEERRIVLFSQELQQKIRSNNNYRLTDEINIILVFLREEEALSISYSAMQNYTAFISPEQAYTLWYAWHKKLALTSTSTTSFESENQTTSFQQYLLMQALDRNYQDDSFLSNFFEAIQRLPKPAPLTLSTLAITGSSSSTSPSEPDTTITETNHLNIWFVMLLKSLKSNAVTLSTSSSINEIQSAMPGSSTEAETADMLSLAPTIKALRLTSLATGLLHIAKEHAKYLSADAHPLTLALILLIQAKQEHCELFQNESLCQIVLDCLEANKALRNAFFIEVNLLFSMVYAKETGSSDTAGSSTDAVTRLNRSMHDTINFQFKKRIAANPTRDAYSSQATLKIYMSVEEYNTILHSTSEIPEAHLTRKTELLAQSMATNLVNMNKNASSHRGGYSIIGAAFATLIETCTQFTVAAFNARKEARRTQNAETSSLGANAPLSALYPERQASSVPNPGQNSSNSGSSLMSSSPPPSDESSCSIC